MQHLNNSERLEQQCNDPRVVILSKNDENKNKAREKACCPNEIEINASDDELKFKFKVLRKTNLNKTL